MTRPIGVSRALVSLIVALAAAVPTQDIGVDEDDDRNAYEIGGDLNFKEINLVDLGIEYARTTGCTITTDSSDRPCWRGEWVTAPIMECADDEDPLTPLARRERLDGGSWTRWVLVSPWSCPGDREGEVELTIREVERLPVAVPSIVVQPGGGKALVNIETVFHAPDAGEQGFSARVAGHTVDVVVRPVAQDWDFGDGTTWTGNDPGAPWPDFTVHRMYDQTGTFATSLATTWAARFRVDSGSWRDVDGTITTDVTADPVEVVERRTHLLAPG